MPNPCHIATIALVSVFANTPVLHAQSQWRFEANQYDLRKASIEQKSIALGVNCSTRLQFQATQDGKGSTGMLGLEFTISPISLIKKFDFGYFEGPDAPVGGRKLMRVTVFKEGKPFVHTLGLGGWGSAEVDDGFVFGTSSRTSNKEGTVRKIIDQVLQGAESLEVAIIDSKNRSIILSAPFPLLGSKPAIESLLKGI